MAGGKIIEGLEGMKYITNGLVGDDLTDYYTSAMYEYPEDVVCSALELLGEWVSDSNNPVSLAMEKQVADFLHIQYNHYNTFIDPVIVLNEYQKMAVIAIYDVTQRLFSGKDVSYIVVYRGFSWSERPEWFNDCFKEGQFICLKEQRTLSSWTFSKEIAEGFVSQNNFGFVLKARMPTECVFAIIDITLEAEAVCISQDDADRFEVVFVKGGDQHE